MEISKVCVVGGEKFRPTPLLEKLVKAGMLGRKSGKGVHQYLS